MSGSSAWHLSLGSCPVGRLFCALGLLGVTEAHQLSSVRAPRPHVPLPRLAGQAISGVTAEPHCPGHRQPGERDVSDQRGPTRDVRGPHGVPGRPEHLDPCHSAERAPVSVSMGPASGCLWLRGACSLGPSPQHSLGTEGRVLRLQGRPEGPRPERSPSVLTHDDTPATFQMQRELTRTGVLELSRGGMWYVAVALTSQPVPQFYADFSKSE